MELINSTRMPADIAVHTEVSGREVLVIVVKGTFRLPEDDSQPLRLDDEQVPLVTSDVFFGEPGRSAPKFEADFAPRKYRCDVLVNGTAWAPNGRPAERVSVGVAIGDWQKSFEVVGDRVWEMAGTGIRSTPAQPFVSMPITYDRAFGGTDSRAEHAADHAAFMTNPSGRGFHRHLRREWVDGSPLPNTEQTGLSVVRPDGAYVPMSFGPIGRQWDPRRRYAGTYDQYWVDEVFPFLPADFDDRYFQAAPADQQLTSPIGGRRVTLLNLTPNGRCTFVLPEFDAPVYVFPKNGAREEHTGRLDTIMIEPDLRRMAMTWRVPRPLKKNVFEIGQVFVGRRPPVSSTGS